SLCRELTASLQAAKARLAQSVEHETLNLRVVGSSPTLGVVFSHSPWSESRLCQTPTSPRNSTRSLMKRNPHTAQRGFQCTTLSCKKILWYIDEVAQMWPFWGFSFFDHSSLLTLKEQVGGSWWFLILSHSSLYVARIGGSVVEFSPATREARVRFPANAAGST